MVSDDVADGPRREPLSPITRRVDKERLSGRLTIGPNRQPALEFGLELPIDGNHRVPLAFVRRIAFLAVVHLATSRIAVDVDRVRSAIDLWSWRGGSRCLYFGVIERDIPQIEVAAFPDPDSGFQ